MIKGNSLKKKDIIPSNVTCGLDTVGIRIPSNEITNNFIIYKINEKPKHILDNRCIK